MLASGSPESTPEPAPAKSADDITKECTEQIAVALMQYGITLLGAYKVAEARGDDPAVQGAALGRILQVGAEGTARTIIKQTMRMTLLSLKGLIDLNRAVVDSNKSVATREGGGMPPTRGG